MGTGQTKLARASSFLQSLKLWGFVERILNPSWSKPARLSRPKNGSYNRFFCNESLESTHFMNFWAGTLLLRKPDFSVWWGDWEVTLKHSFAKKNGKADPYVYSRFFSLHTSRDQRVSFFAKEKKQWLLRTFFFLNLDIFIFCLTRTFASGGG